MAAVYIRNLSPSAYKKLKEQAKLNRRSVSQEAATILDAALGERERTHRLWEQVDRIRERVTARYGSFRDNTPGIREDRKR